MNKLNVLFFQYDRSGSTFYRLLQPAQKLDQYGLCNVGVMERGYSAQARYDAIKISDVLVFYSSASPEMAENFYTLRKAGKKIVMDMNDDIFNVSPYSIHYRVFGTREAVHSNGNGEFVKLWEDGQGGFSIAANRKNLEQQKEVLRAVDLITVTTPYLAKLYSEFNETAVLPDMMDLEALKPLWVTYPENAFRLGWRGGESHYEDLMYVKEPLEKLFQAHANLKLVMSGFCPGSLVRDILPPEDMARFETWGPANEKSPNAGRYFNSPKLEAYPFCGHPAFEWHMMALGCHMAFYPWSDIAFNQGKNNICWQQWSAIGVPGVYPAMAPYTDHVVHGETGLIAGSKEGWFECINKLILDKPLRRRIGRQVRREVEENWDINKGVIKYKEVYENLWTQSMRSRTETEASVATGAAFN